MQTLLGTKMGMTRVFDETGRQIPVTVLAVGPCTVVQRKRTEREGYESVQLGYLDQKESRLTRPLQAHFKSRDLTAKRFLREVRVETDEAGCEEGETVTAAAFQDVEYVDVVGISKGRGFQGVVKRHGMAGGRKTHGGHNLRGGGSIGMCEYPARVFKGKKMPGQMGNRRVTQQNLKVIAVREEDNALLVQGAVPGPTGGLVMVRKAIKKAPKKS